MLLEVAILSFVAGAVLMLVLQVVMVRCYVYGTAPRSPPIRDHFPETLVPEVLKEKLKAACLNKERESCVWLNLVLHFLFQELRDTNFVRRWVKQKMNQEFEELLQSTSGKLLAQIIVRDFSLGTGCPQLGEVSVQNVTFDDEDEVITCLDMHLDVDYNGGFTLGVDVLLPFNKTAFVSVTVQHLSGRARIQLNRNPYTHWSFSFLQEPEVQFEVESHFEGRPLPQVASIIISQMRRVIRQKHTLPNYKMRYKPLFRKPEVPLPTCRLKLGNQSISAGRLCITFIKCTRLPLVPQDATIYCILCADTQPWKELVRGQNKVWVMHDVEVIKGQTDSLGMNFKDEYLLDRRGMAVTVDVVQLDSAAARADIRKGDVLISVGNSRITSSRHAAKMIKNAGDRFTIRLERPQVKLSQDFRFQEQSSYSKDTDGTSRKESGPVDDEDFVHITVQHTESDSNLIATSSHQAIDKEFGLSSGGSSADGAPVRTGIVLQPSHSTGQLLRPSSGDVPTHTGSPRFRRKSQVTGSQSFTLTTEAAKTPLTSHSKSGHGSPRKDHSPARDHCNLAAHDKRADDSVGSVSHYDSDGDDESSPIMKTREVPAVQNPRWHDPLTFDLNEHHTYMNICVWCHLTETNDTKLDKPSSTPQSSRDLLLGQVSVPINMIVLHCLMTLRGITKQTLQLHPGEVKAGASRTNMEGRIGFDPQLCYGSITLHLQFTPSHLSKLQQRTLAVELDPADLAAVHILPASESSQDEQGSDAETGFPEGKHLFSKVQFDSVTYCNFCGKKIWFKAAVQCIACGMICHKKCIDKCHAETLCSPDGPRRKSAPGEFWRTPLASLKQAETVMGAHLPQTQTRGSRFLSKFTKDPSSSTASEKGAVKSPRSPQFLRRAQAREEGDSKIAHESLFPQGTLDDAAMTSAKQTGRQLFLNLDLSSRKAKLDIMVNKTQGEIDQETANKAILVKQLQAADSEATRTSLAAAVSKSNKKIESLMLLQLQYCAGLQHCLDQEEKQRQRRVISGKSQTDSLLTETSSESTHGSGADHDSMEDASKDDEQGAVEVVQEQTVSVVAQVLDQLIRYDEESSASEDSEGDWR